MPTCTVAQIDAAQSDSVCPQGSLIAEGTTIAELGPSTDTHSNVVCHKKSKMYNSGKGEQAYYLYGDPSQCAGVDYLAPLKATVTPGKGTQGDQVLITLESNLQHPLPGLDGGITEATIVYKKIILNNNKRTGFAVSTGCGKSKERKVTFTISYSNDVLPPREESAVASKC